MSSLPKPLGLSFGEEKSGPLWVPFGTDTLEHIVDPVGEFPGYLLFGEEYPDVELVELVCLQHGYLVLVDLKERLVPVVVMDLIAWVSFFVPEVHEPVVDPDIAGGEESVRFFWVYC